MYIIKKLMINGKKQIVKKCTSEREAISELEKIYTLTETFYITKEN